MPKVSQVVQDRLKMQLVIRDRFGNDAVGPGMPAILPGM